MTPISTVEELLAVTNNLACSYVLTADIDLDGEDWTPIGNQDAAFTGEFYGQGHRILNFCVEATNRYVGLFGKISGGRVSGVVLEGTVTGASDSSDTNVGVGGFAGKIDSKSLMDGCSFQGAVTNSTTYSAGGFVGYTDDSPVILRSCVLRATVANTSSQMFAGGFVAWLSGGYVMDCYAVADVESDGSYVGGFAGFVNGSITNAWCAGSVTVSGSSHGAFAGDSDPGKITNSYYDYGKTSLSAVNNACFKGITGRTSQQMLHAASFAFDFDRTWQIDEGKTTPYLRTFLVIDPPDGYFDPEGSYIENDAVVDWLSGNGFTQADIDALGGDAAATARLYDCYLANCDFRVENAGARLGFSAISVGNGVVSVTVELFRKAPLGSINGVLNFYGADDLADGFGSSPIPDASVDFGADDATFAADPTAGSVTQTATANISNATEKFFKAAIEDDVPNNEGP